MDQLLGWLSSWWASLDPDLQWDLWFGSGVAGLALWALVAHEVMRRLLGHRKHRGTWYNERQYAELMQLFEETAQVRVLQHEDMVALRTWKYGDTVKPLFGDRKYGGYTDL